MTSVSMKSILRSDCPVPFRAQKSTSTYCETGSCDAEPLLPSPSPPMNIKNFRSIVSRKGELIGGGHEGAGQLPVSHEWKWKLGKERTSHHSPSIPHVWASTMERNFDHDIDPFPDGWSNCLLSRSVSIIKDKPRRSSVETTHCLVHCIGRTYIISGLTFARSTDRSNLWPWQYIASQPDFRFHHGTSRAKQEKDIEDKKRFTKRLVQFSGITAKLANPRKP